MASERSDRVQSALLAVLSRFLPTYLFHLFRVSTFPRHLSIFPAISWEDGVGEVFVRWMRSHVFYVISKYDMTVGFTLESDSGVSDAKVTTGSGA